MTYDQKELLAKELMKALGFFGALGLVGCAIFWLLTVAVPRWVYPVEEELKDIPVITIRGMTGGEISGVKTTGLIFVVDCQDVTLSRWHVNGSDLGGYDVRYFLMRVTSTNTTIRNSVFENVHGRRSRGSGGMDGFIGSGDHGFKLMDRP